jgi:hypothetical protein
MKKLWIACPLVKRKEDICLAVVASAMIDRLGRLGIDLHAMTGKLQIDGIEAFAFDRVIAALDRNRQAILVAPVH